MSDVGFKMGVDGNTEFKKAISDINSNLKVLGSELKSVTSEFDKNDKSVEALTAKNKVLNKQIDEQKTKVSTLEDALKNSVDTYGENSKETQQWTIKLNEAKAKLNNLEREVKQNDDAMNGLGDEVKRTGNEMDETGKKSNTFKDMLKANLTGAAIIGGIKAIGSAIKSLGTSMMDTVKKSAEVGDAIDKGSQKLQISSDAYQELSFAANRCGTSITTLATANKTLKGTSYTGDLKQAIIAVAGIADESERAAKATELFGKKAGQEMLPLLNSGAEGVNALCQQAHELNGVMSEEAVKASAAFEDSLTNLQLSFDGLKNNLGGQFLPGITDIMDGLTLMLTGHMDEGKAKVDEGIAKIESVLQELAPFASTLISEITKVLMENMPTIIDCAFSLAKAFVSEMLKPANVYKGFYTATDLIIELVNSLVNVVSSQAGIEQMAKVGEAIASGIIKAVKAHFKQKWDLFTANVDDEYGISYMYNNVHPDRANGFGNAVGLKYVPYDNYPANLHEGEMVLPKTMAELLRSAAALPTQSGVKTGISTATLRNMQSQNGGLPQMPVMGDTKVTINFAGDLAQLARVITPKIDIEHTRIGNALA